METSLIKTDALQLEQSLGMLKTRAERSACLGQLLHVYRTSLAAFTLQHGARYRVLKQLTQNDYELFHRSLHGLVEVPFTPAGQKLLLGQGISDSKLLCERLELEHRLFYIKAHIQLYESRLQLVQYETEQAQTPTECSPGDLEAFLEAMDISTTVFDALLEKAGITTKGKIRKNGLAAKAFALGRVLVEKQLLQSNQEKLFRDMFTCRYIGKALTRGAYTNAKATDK